MLLFYKIMQSSWEPTHTETRTVVKLFWIHTPTNAPTHTHTHIYYISYILLGLLTLTIYFYYLFRYYIHIFFLYSFLFTESGLKCESLLPVATRQFNHYCFFAVILDPFFCSSFSHTYFPFWNAHLFCFYFFSIFFGGCLPFAARMFPQFFIVLLEGFFCCCLKAPLLFIFGFIIISYIFLLFFLLHFFSCYSPLGIIDFNLVSLLLIK